MFWVTEEEYQAAKQVRAYEYLQTYQPGRLKKTRTRNEWQLQDHDSFKINEITSKWHWKSRDIGGMSALRFLMQVDGMGYTEAVKILCEQTPVYVPRAEPATKKKTFALPLPNDSFYRVRRYLNQRGIRDEVLDYCVQLGILYESAPTITLFLLAWMNRDVQGMRSCGESMTTGERVFGWNRKAVKSNTAFVFLLLGKAAGWQYMKPVLTPWLI